MAYFEPRFVSFCDGGKSLIVGFFEQAIMYAIFDFRHPRTLLKHLLADINMLLIHGRLSSNTSSVRSKESLTIEICKYISSDLGLISHYFSYRANAVMLQDEQMIMYNLRDGIDIFSKFSCVRSARFNINPCCSQGVCVVGDGAFMAGISTKGKIRIYRTRDATLSTVLRVSG